MPITKTRLTLLAYKVQGFRQGSAMIARPLANTFLLVASLSFPLLAAPHETAVPGDTNVVCGEALGIDLFNQTFLVQVTKSVETVPFSRWTDFVTRSTDGQGRRHTQAVDPTDVRIGDRLCIVLDPSGATADRIEVLPGRRATEMARASAK
jgi:hypothetical protein